MTWSCQYTAKCLAEDRLSELSTEEREALSQHFKACPACRAEVAEERALDELLSGFLQPAASRSSPSAGERSELAEQARAAISKRPSRRLPGAILRTLKWAAVALLVVVGCMAATESGRKQLAKLPGVVERWFTVTWQPSRPEATYSWTSNEPFDREEKLGELAEIDKLMLAGKGRLVGVIESPDLTVYMIEYTLSGGKKITIGSSRPDGLQAEAIHLEEIERLRREGKGRLISQKDFPLGLGSFEIAYILSNGEEVVLSTQYPPGPESERERIFKEIRELQEAGKGGILHAAEDETGRRWGTVQYTLSDGRTVGVVETLKAEQVPEAPAPDER